MEFANFSKQTVVNKHTVQHIQNNPKVFADAIRLSNQKINNAYTPERRKIHLTDEQVRLFGDGTTGDKIRTFFLNLWLLLSNSHGENYFFGENVVDREIKASEQRSEMMRVVGLDDTNDSDRFNALHFLPPDELDRLITVTHILHTEGVRQPLRLEGDQEEQLHKLQAQDIQTDFEIVANQRGIWLRKVDDTVFEPVKIMSLEAYNAISTLDNVLVHLEPEARLAFQPYFALEEFYNVDSDAPIVSGKSGGSPARAVLLGIHAGRVNLNGKGAEYLAELINMEVRGLTNPKAKDSKREVEVLNLLSRSLTYHDTGPQLILMGDVADDPIKRGMIANGAAFIPCSAGDLDTVAQIIDHEKKTFPVTQRDLCNNAFHDPEKRTLFLPQGIALNSEGQIETAFGVYQPSLNFNPSQDFSLFQFTFWMNSQSLPKPDTEKYKKFINFQPDEKAIYEAANALNITIVITRDDPKDSRAGNVKVIHPLKDDQPLSSLLVGRIGVNDKLLTRKEQDDSTTTSESITVGSYGEGWEGDDVELQLTSQTTELIKQDQTASANREEVI